MSYRCSCWLLPLRVCQGNFAAAISRTVANIFTILKEPLEETLRKASESFCKASVNAACPSYWESPMGNAKLHRILRFRMGSHHLPVEEGRRFKLPRASRVCNLCNTDALGDERHMLLECPALADLRLQFSSLLLPCSGVMRRLLWAKDQHEVCRYIIACLDRMSSH